VIGRMLLARFLASLMLLSWGQAAVAGGCQILTPVDFSKLLGMDISQVASNHPVMDTGEGHVHSNLWHFTPEAMKSVDARIKRVDLWVVNKFGPESLRGRVEMVSLAVPDILLDEDLYQAYLGGCGRGDPRREGTLLRKDICLWATHTHDVSVEITSEKMERLLFKNPKLRSCRPS
jgi:hypothetical protein